MGLKPWKKDEDIEHFRLLSIESRDQPRGDAPRSRIASHRRSSKGWRGTVAAGCLITLTVLILNIALLATGLRKPEAGRGVHILFQGSCETMRSSFIVVHVVINLLSTLLLGASNAAMQCLAAPTRAEVDKAHEKGSWVHIGVFGLRNIRFMPWKRILLCSVLALSSVPLHLVYNSAIFSKTGAWQPIAPVRTMDVIVILDMSVFVDFEAGRRIQRHERIAL